MECDRGFGHCLQLVGPGKPVRAVVGAHNSMDFGVEKKQDTHLFSATYRGL